MHGSTARCLTAACAFKSALQRYARAAQTETEQLTAAEASIGGISQSEQMRAQLKPLKKLHDAVRATLKVLLIGMPGVNNAICIEHALATLM